MSHDVPTTWIGKSIEETNLADEVIAIARVRGGSVEIVTSQQSWQRGDEVIVMTRGASAVAVPRPDRQT
jgi:Trk K+ transport system NAD-binding subunit